MPVVCLGIDHHHAPVAFRERLAFSTEDLRALYGRFDLGEFERHTGIGEVVIVSTCNRVEVYAAARDPGFHFSYVPSDLGSVVVNGREVELRELQAYSSSYHGLEAVRHLGRVACGLDSMVLGESEILGQVKAARDLAAEEGVLGPVLDAAFHTAIRSAGRARAQTGISRRPVSVTSVAIEAATELVGPLANRRVLIVGSGKMGRLGGRVFKAKGVAELAVVSRTRAHAESLAREWNAAALAWHELPRAIAEADVVFTSTAAPHAVITRELLLSALGPTGRQRPLLVLDIAVPRDVEPEAHEFPNVHVVDMDELKERQHGNLAERGQAAAEVDAILELELRKFEEWRHEAELRPLITAMRSRTEEIRRQEVARFMDRFADAPPEVRLQVDKLSRSLVNRLLHEPTRRLKKETDQRRSDTYAKVTRELFGLAEPEWPEASGM